MLAEGPPSVPWTQRATPLVPKPPSSPLPSRKQLPPTLRIARQASVSPRHRISLTLSLTKPSGSSSCKKNNPVFRGILGRAPARSDGGDGDIDEGRT
ncbi:unnamed protein product [Lampetra fluviatilis]